jgi:hypothetical protein
MDDPPGKIADLDWPLGLFFAAIVAAEARAAQCFICEAGFTRQFRAS